MKARAGKRFDGKTAIVTGASGGIGGAIVDGGILHGFWADPSRTPPIPSKPDSLRS